MTTEVVLDASAILANILREPGTEVVQEAAFQAVVSPVNLAEVVAKLIDLGMDEREAEFTTFRTPYRVAPADRSQAISVGRLYPRIRRLGISLGDRFCLALAQETGRPILTADRKWKELEGVLGIEVTLIR